MPMPTAYDNALTEVLVSLQLAANKLSLLIANAPAAQPAPNGHVHSYRRTGMTDAIAKIMEKRKVALSIGVLHQELRNSGWDFTGSVSRQRFQISQHLCMGTRTSKFRRVSRGVYALA